MHSGPARPFVGNFPPGLLERVRALASGQLEPVPARPSATVALLRDTSRGIEVFLLRRVASMAFAAGMHVFPGGGVDPRDAWVDAGAPVAPPEQWPALLSADPALTAALACAAVRETFEECGVLLAAGRDQPQGVLPDVSGTEWERDRLALAAHEVALSELLARRGLALRADLLGPWAHWITPDFEQRRFDTRFFVAALPSGQQARHVGGESERSVWIRPADAVAGYEDGALPMLPPTVAVLRELAGYPEVAAVLAAVPGRTIRPVQPVAVLDGQGARLVLPGEAGVADD